jgi:mannonate dehydratase
MRLASVLTPLSDHNLRLASQCGVDEVVLRYPGPDPAQLLALKSRVESFGMRAGVVEGYLPIENIKLGSAGYEAELDAMEQLVRAMGRAGIPILCYNFMAGGDWSRTSFTERGRGGALVSAFDLAAAEAGAAQGTAAPEAAAQSLAVSEDALWANLRRFLDRMVPVAEQSGVVLTMHPDDPPVPRLRGMPRALYSVDAFERLLALNPSPANAICFCQGTFTEMGIDIPAAIARLGHRIRYVHFRDVRGTAAKFVETFQDEGQTDMFEAMCAYRRIGFDGPMQPDHVPQLDGEEDGSPGYTMLGRLFAFGYIRGLMQAAARAGPEPARRGA